MSLPVNEFRAVGGFDPRYFLYYEDLDLCARLAVAFPNLRATLAVTPPGRHQVGAAGSQTPTDVRATAKLRLDSAITYAARPPGNGLARHPRRPGRAAKAGSAMTDVAVVHLGRPQARGEVRRVRSWCDVLTAAGLTVTEIPLHPRALPDLLAAPAVLAGRAVPETMAWSGTELRSALARVEPRAVIVVSLRAFRADLLTGRTVVLDLVDPLDRAYRDRRALTGGLRAFGYRTLAAAHRRVQSKLGRSALRVVAAGWHDAADLGVGWIPVTVDPDTPQVEPTGADHDLVFTGTLSYPPNIESLQRLARIWPALQSRRPGTTMLVAGARPGPAVRDLCRATSWTLVADFASPAEVLARARLAVAPLDHTAGLQIKVLDAAAHGVSQIATPAALRGFAPELDVPTAETDEAFVDAMTTALDNLEQWAAAARVRRDQVLADYGVERWATPVRELLGF